MSLVVDSLSKQFGSVTALDHVSFDVEAGHVFGFLGPNGAGKTTTMRIILNILRADTGTVTWNGRSSVRLPRRTWGYLPEERGLYPRMEVLGQLVFFGSLYGLSRRRAADEARAWLRRFRIEDAERRRAEELSRGNQQKVQLIAAILHDPEVLLLDEPFSGLDPVNVAILKDALLEIRDRGKTILFSTHQMEMVEELCQSVVIIDHGRVRLGGSVRDVKRTTGRKVVRLGVSGDPALRWLAELEDVRVTRSGQDYSEMDVLGTRDPESVLEAALARGEHVVRFEITEPSIEQVFIETVGSAPLEDRTLAPAATARPVGVAR